ncbi:MAG: hypothetical protein AB7P37_22810, partial [Ramlibacter sp.]
EFLLAGLLGFCKADLAHRLNSFARINAPPPNSVDLFRPSLELQRKTASVNRRNHANILFFAARDVDHFSGLVGNQEKPS